MAQVFNIKFVTTVENGAVKAILLGDQGQELLVGWSRGRRGPNDSADNRQLAFDRLQKQLVKAGVSMDELTSAQWNYTDVTIHSATAGQPKTPMATVSLAALVSGAVVLPAKGKKVEPKVEGNITAANVASGKDCGLVTPATNRPAFVQIANAAVNTVAGLNEELLESGCEVGDERKNVNALMETGSEGAAAVGMFRQDSNGKTFGQQVGSEVVDPTTMPIEHKDQKSLPSINARKGAAPLVTRAPVTVGQFVTDKRTAKRNANGFVKAQKEESDPFAKALGGFYGRNIVEALGGGIDAESMFAGGNLARSLRAKDVESKAAVVEFNRLAQLDGRRTIWDGGSQASDNSVAYKLGYTVGMLRQGRSDGKVNGSAGFNGAHKPGYLELLANVGLVVRLHNGNVLLNDRPVTWDADFVATLSDLFVSADKAVNG
jgi:hypothetical protein